jgi:hypothetical protein
MRKSKTSRLLALALALVLTMAGILSATAKSIDDFADASNARAVLAEKRAATGGSDVYEEAVQFMVDLNVMEGSAVAGTNLRNLNLGSTLTRAEFAVMLYKMYNGGEPIEIGGSDFVNMGSVASDTANHWARPYANWIFTTGISAGVGIGGDGKPLFAPNRSISFNEALLLCLKAIGIDTDIETYQGFTYPAGVPDVALQIELATGNPMITNLFQTSEGLIDRATTALLFEYTIRQNMIDYTPTGERYFLESSLLIERFGFGSDSWDDDGYSDDWHEGGHDGYWEDDWEDDGHWDDWGDFDEEHY